MTQHKTPAKHLMLGLLRLSMIEIQRLQRPPDYFPITPQGSSILGALRKNELEDDEYGPDYILEAPMYRTIGKCRMQHLSAAQCEDLHQYFLDSRPLYTRAHAKVKGI